MRSTRGLCQINVMSPIMSRVVPVILGTLLRLFLKPASGQSAKKVVTQLRSYFNNLCKLLKLWSEVKTNECCWVKFFIRQFVWPRVRGKFLNWVKKVLSDMASILAKSEGLHNPKSDFYKDTQYTFLLSLFATFSFYPLDISGHNLSTGTNALCMMTSF